LQAVWPRSDLLVWVGGGLNFWWWLDGPLTPAIGAAIIAPWPPFRGGSGGHLIAFDVSDSTTPQFTSEVDLGTNSWWSFSKAFTADGLVYLSHQTSEFLPWVIPFSPTPVVAGAAVGDGVVAVGDPVVAQMPAGSWVSRAYLDVVDYADARQPLVREAVNIPGTLSGISHRGAVLYSVGTHFMTNGPSDWTEFLDASAYDGVSAHLIDSLSLPNAWPRPLLVTGTNIFIGRSGYTNGWWAVSPNGVADVGPHYLESWFLSMSGRLMQSGRMRLASPANALADFDALLATQETDNTVVLFDASNGAALRQVGQAQPAGCLWFDLNHADGQLGNGLWVPLGVYGAAKIAAGP
jgi:hypothetical protein